MVKGTWKGADVAIKRLELTRDPLLREEQLREMQQARARRLCVAFCPPLPGRLCCGSAWGMHN